MVGPMEKGLSRAKLCAPPVGAYEGVDLRVLPEYICFKAALLKEKLTLKYVCLILVMILGVQFAVSRLEVTDLVTKLREKEYILAPGVLDFTPASPQSVSDSYVQDAVLDFIGRLGNVNPTNIEEQYEGLKRFMSDSLKVKFDMETASWVEQVRADGISQIMTAKEKTIVSNQQGAYKATVLARAEFYSNHEYLGHEDQIVELTMRLTPPQSGQRWFLEIQSLHWGRADSFRVKNNLKTGGNGQ